MNIEKLHIEKNTIQETLVIPLFARKLCTELYPNLFQDHSAIRLMDRLDYDFSSLRDNSNGLVQRFGALEIAMRQTDLQIEIKEYLKDHPKAAVVNMGCGLDETAENCDNGQCLMYNIDMPDVMEVRNKLIPPKERVTNLAVDLNDPAWFELVDGSNGSVFFAAGVFYYFTAEQVKDLFNGMAKHFPGGKLVLDTGNKSALKMMMKTVIKQSGIENIGAYFHVNDMDKDVSSWLQNAKASYKPYMYGYNDLKDPSVSRAFRILAHLGDKIMGLKILRLDFDR